MITTVTCAHNPRIDVLERVLAALIGQTKIQKKDYEIVVIDNRSDKPLTEQVSVELAVHVRFVREDKLGLTAARLRGLAEAKGDLIVFVDDDNILRPDYLAIVQDRFAANSTLGALGGRAIPVFACEPPTWFSIERYSLGCRDMGDTAALANWRDVSRSAREYPACAPIGGGMAIRRSALAHYANTIANDAKRQALDRTGESLASGGDNDIVMSVLDNGLDVGYEPRLRLDHIIPVGRTSIEYLSRYQYETMVTWVMALDAHGIRPWSALPRWSLPLRRVRAWLRLRAWRSEIEYLDWMAACGMLEGRARLRDATRS